MAHDLTASADNGVVHESTWDFLSPWFERLRGRVRVCVGDHGDFVDSVGGNPYYHDRDRVRLAGDASDCWLRVELFPRGWRMPWRYRELKKKSVEMCESYTRGELRAVREALLLTTALAEICYSAWYERMCTHAAMKVPSGIDVFLAKMPRRIEMDCNDLLYTLRHFYSKPMAEEFKVEAAKRAWTSTFGYDNLSAQFKLDYARLWQCTIRSQSVGCVSIPMRLRFKLKGSYRISDCVKEVESLAQAISSLQCIITTPSSNSDASSTHFPTFVLDSLDVDMSNLNLHPEVFRAVRKFITECGVPFRSLALPATRVIGVESDAQAFQLQWMLLSRTMAGLFDSATPVRIDHFRLQPIHAGEDLAASLFSSLAHARGIQALFVRASSHEVIDGGQQRRLLAWIAHALLANSSSSSINVLSLHLPTLQESDVAAMAKVANDKSGLQWLWEIDTGCSAPETSRSGVDPHTLTIAYTTMVTPDRNSNATTRSSATIELPYSVHGTIVWENLVAGVLHVLLPGYGFCSIKQDAARVKRSRVSLTALECGGPILVPEPEPLSTLILNLREITDTDSAVQALIRLTGNALISLRIEANRLQEATAQAVMTECPRLRHLGLFYLESPTMDAFIAGYERGVPLESLCLQGGHGGHTLEGMDRFLEQLATPSSSATQTLRQLRLGRLWWIHPRIDSELMFRVLGANPRLCFFEMPLLRQPDALQQDLNQFNCTVVTRPLPDRAKYAFLSVLRKRETTEELHRDVVCAIVAFAAEFSRRTVRVFVNHELHNFQRD